MLRVLVSLVVLAGCLPPPEPTYYVGNAPPAPYGYAPPPPPAYGYAQAQPAPDATPRASCRMGSDGRQACGFDCKIGSDGVAACANAPGGSCALGADGRVYCSHAPAFAPRSTVRSTCHLNSDGTRTCGYNCRFGAGGYHYCASTPNGTCGMNSDGSYTCS